MYLKFAALAYFRTRNSNLKSVSNKNQLEILIKFETSVLKFYKTLVREFLYKFLYVLLLCIYKASKPFSTEDHWTSLTFIHPKVVLTRNHRSIKNTVLTNFLSIKGFLN